MKRKGASKQKFKSMSLNSKYIRGIGNLFRRFQNFRSYSQFLKRRQRVLVRNSAGLSVSILVRSRLFSQVHNRHRSENIVIDELFSIS